MVKKNIYNPELYDKRKAQIYYETNKLKIAEQRKEYYNKNKQKIKLYHKQYQLSYVKKKKHIYNSNEKPSNGLINGFLYI
tara:strand:+ start:621 stop:860 length:240 start_codon:yes stop_codon:yes gene_type:complete